MSLVVNLNDDPSSDFQQGREAGRFWSEWQSKLEVGIGLGAAASGVDAMPPTAAAAVAAAPESGATSLVVGGVGIIVEGGVVAGGLAEAAHGAGVLAYIKGSQVGASSTYRDRFYTKYPGAPRDYPIHHRIPQKARDLGLFSAEEVDSIDNLRAISAAEHKKINNEWAKFWKLNPEATRQDVLDFARSIDDKYGDSFWKP
jgi:hypothetical protein